jgi:hypothetical protein
VKHDTKASQRQSAGSTAPNEGQYAAEEVNLASSLLKRQAGGDRHRNTTNREFAEALKSSPSSALIPRAGDVETGLQMRGCLRRKPGKGEPTLSMSCRRAFVDIRSTLCIESVTKPFTTAVQIISHQLYHLLDILTNRAMDSYDACMLHVHCMHAYLALDCWAVHSDEYTSATSCIYTSQPLL